MQHNATDNTPKELFDGITQQMLVAYPDAGRCCVLLWDTEKGGLMSVADATGASRGTDGHTHSLPSLLSKRLRESVIENRKGVLSRREPSDPVGSLGDGVEAYICVPILIRGEVEKTLYAASLTSRSAFTTDDLTVLCIIAHRVGMTLENLRLRSEPERTQEGHE